MARRKTAKRSLKRTSSMNKVSVMQKMEKDFYSIPSKLTAQVNKDVTTLKQKENKLKTAVNKLKAKVKTSATRLKLATQNKATRAGKKQFKTAKKINTNNMQTFAALNKELAAISQQMAIAAAKQSKLLALRKHLSQFEKEWANNAKKVKTKTKQKSNKASKSKRAKQEFNETAQAQSYNAAADEMRMDETTELNS